MKKIFFSVVVTSYNSSKYIKKTLNSLLNQNFENFEVIMVDDGSSDNTISIANKFKLQKKFRFKIIKLSHKGSPARSRNIGIKISKGKYLFFLDADDLFFKNKLFYIYKNLPTKNPDVIYHDVKIRHIKKNYISKKITKKNPLNDLILNGNKIILSSSAIKKKFITEKNIRFNEDRKLISVEDYDFWLQIAKNKGDFFLFNKILGVYNLNDNSISKKRYLHFINTFYLLKIYEEYIIKKNTKFFLKKIKIFMSFIKLSIVEKNFHFFLSLLNCKN